MNDVDRIKAKIDALTERIQAGDESAREELHVMCLRQMRALAQELAAQLIRESKPREIGEEFYAIDLPTILVNAAKMLKEPGYHPGCLLQAMFEMGFTSGVSHAKRHGVDHADPEERLPEQKAFVDVTNSPN